MEEAEATDTSFDCVSLCDGCKEPLSGNGAASLRCRVCAMMRFAEKSFCSKECLQRHTKKDHDPESVTLAKEQYVDDDEKENRKDDSSALNASVVRVEEEEDEAMEIVMQEEEEAAREAEEAAKNEEEEEEGEVDEQEMTVVQILSERLRRIRVRQNRDRPDDAIDCCATVPERAKCERWIQGVRVLFPHPRPHPTQMTLMVNVIDALRKRGHAALESPTGTGKTAALLCAALAWHSTYKSQRRRYFGKNSSAVSTKRPTSTASRRRKRTPVVVDLIDDDHDDDDDDDDAAAAPAFVSAASVKSEPSTGLTQPMKRAKVSPPPQKQTLPDGYREHDTPCRIFYGTRTQAQVKNVVRELKSLTYKPNLCVLGSRKFLCACADEIAQEVPSGVSLSVACRQRVMKRKPTRHDDDDDGAAAADADTKDADDQTEATKEAKKCAYHERLLHESFAQRLYDGTRSERKKIMDIEDLSAFVVAGRDDDDEEDGAASYSAPLGACPYYTAHVLKEDADIVICPYNYLLDPGIRAAMNIDLKGSAVILDEAHNMASVCRDAGSLDIDLRRILELEQLCCMVSTLTRWKHKQNSVAKAAATWVDFCERIAFGLVRVDATTAFPSGSSAGKEHAIRIWKGSESDVASSQKKRSKGSSRSNGNLRSPDGTVLQFLRGTLAPYDVGSAIAELNESAAILHDAAVEKGSRKAWWLGQIPIFKRAVAIAWALSLAAKHPDAYVAAMLRKEIDEIDATRSVPLGPCRAHQCGKQHKEDRFTTPSLMRASDDRPRRLRFVLWLMDASVTFSDVARTAHSVILASGTMHPMQCMLSELGEDFYSRLRRRPGSSALRTFQGMHVLEQTSKQLFVAALGVSPCGYTLNGSRKATLGSSASSSAKTKRRSSMNLFNRARYKRNPQFRYYEAVGNAVISICEVTPDGVLLFVPSYAKLDAMIRCWKQCFVRSGDGGTVWDNISRIKSGAIVVEETSSSSSSFSFGSKSDANAASSLTPLERFAKGVHSGRGALMIAVCRGKMSEGMNLNNAMVRAVVVLGIPYPSSVDLNVQSKMAFNDEKLARFERRSKTQQETSMPCLGGWDFYRQSAFEAVNQAVGRVHRHQRDYGAMILLDDRYCDERSSRAPLRNFLSKWYRGHVRRNFRRFAEFRFCLKEFFDGVPEGMRVSGAAQRKSDVRKMRAKRSKQRVVPSMFGPNARLESSSGSGQGATKAEMPPPSRATKTTTRKRRPTIVERLQRASSSSSDAAASVTPNDVERAAPKTRSVVPGAPECCVCLENVADIAFTPCGHLCVCEACVLDICSNGLGSEGSCPICCETGTAHRLIF